MSKKIFIITGELSGETHASKVLEEVLAVDPEIKVQAMGSSLLESLGAKLIADYKDYSYTGITSVIINIFKILRLKNIILKAIKDFEPDLLLIVDYAGFNLEIAKAIKENFPKEKRPLIFEYIAPQLWASRPKRILKVKRYVDKVLCTLPFEEDIYLRHQIPVRYVGNPVSSSLTEPMSQEDFLLACQIPSEPVQRLIGIFPGSRKPEIKYLLPIMIEAAQKLQQKNQNFKFILAKAPTISRELLAKYGLTDALEKNLIRVLSHTEMPNANHKLMSAADALWLCSGTATLEASLYTTPYFLTYKGNWINYQIYKMLRIINMAGLANIIAGKYLVKEFLQYEANAENFIRETLSWFDTENTAQSTDYYRQIKTDLENLKNSLSRLPTAKIVAEEILSGLIQSSHRTYNAGTLLQPR
jgi:lipid-A-disaccharide synthase